MIAYQAQMLPQVDYQKIKKIFQVPKCVFEHHTMQDFAIF